MSAATKRRKAAPAKRDASLDGLFERLERNIVGNLIAIDGTIRDRCRKPLIAEQQVIDGLRDELARANAKRDETYGRLLEAREQVFWKAHHIRSLERENYALRAQVRALADKDRLSTSLLDRATRPIVDPTAPIGVKG